MVGALPRLPFASRVFGAVGANFVINHTSDPRAAARELRRVCTPGGGVVLMIWPERLIAVDQLWNDVLLASGVEPAGQGLTAELDFSRTPAGLAELLSEAGTVDVTVVELEVVLRVSPDKLQKAAPGGVATIGAVYRGQPLPQRWALARRTTPSPHRGRSTVS